MLKPTAHFLRVHRSKASIKWSEAQGRFVPPDCRQLTITRVQSGTTELCVLNFEPSGDPGFLDQLRRAAVPTQWWVSCENLARR